uniref:Uncharacterized protein n=1 Tax=Candidatus Methanophaga sp. ANME-1 ERB7 TaxID=2759913 RepID=A0A7G9ZB37_9EURY|nr:hypothetical protein PBOADKMI_00016 [Methanosarcinales archaeon ANME-1 ERB7]
MNKKCLMNSKRNNIRTQHLSTTSLNHIIPSIFIYPSVLTVYLNHFCQPEPSPPRAYPMDFQYLNLPTQPGAPLRHSES